MVTNLLVQTCCCLVVGSPPQPGLRMHIRCFATVTSHIMDIYLLFRQTVARMLRSLFEPGPPFVQQCQSQKKHRDMVSRETPIAHQCSQARCGPGAPVCPHAATTLSIRNQPLQHAFAVDRSPLVDQLGCFAKALVKLVAWSGHHGRVKSADQG